MSGNLAASRLLHVYPRIQKSGVGTDNEVGLVGVATLRVNQIPLCVHQTHNSLICERKTHLLLGAPTSRSSTLEPFGLLFNHTSRTAEKREDLSSVSTSHTTLAVLHQPPWVS